MTSGLQHCPSCDEEYVAGVAACVECGGTLQPGPLERLEKSGRARRDPIPPADPGAAAAPARLLGEMPGLQADHVVRALLREDIACVVDCRGVRKVYAPDQPPAEPFAVTLPVSVYVPDAHYDAAQDIVASLDAGDVIGDQWSDAATDAEAEGALEVEPATEPGAPPADAIEPAQTEDQIAGDAGATGEPAAESTSLRTVVLIVLAAIVLLFLFGR